MMNSALKMMSCALKMMSFASQMMNSAMTMPPLDRLLIASMGHRQASYFRVIKCLAVRLSTVFSLISDRFFTDFRLIWAWNLNAQVERLTHIAPFFEAFVERWTVIIPGIKKR